MRHQFWRPAMIAMFVGAILLFLSLFDGGTSGVLAQEEATPEPATVFITTPRDGETLSGMMTVTGAVYFSDFVKYEVMLQSGDQVSWVATGYSSVINGNLARLDTRLFLNGTYQMIIRQVNSDSNYTDYLGPTITIANEDLGSPLTKPDIESSFLYPPVTGALLRIRNCGDKNLEFDYKSREGFCSAQDLWIKPKTMDHPFCPSMDVQLIACPYEGSAVGEGESQGSTYSFEAEEGKIYEYTYAGNGRFYLGEVAGDERASTDTGEQKQLQAAQGGTQASGTLLPISGQGQATNLYFIGVALGLIFLLIVGGVIALRRQSYTP